MEELRAVVSFIGENVSFQPVWMQSSRKKNGLSLKTGHF
jgi:hypothetical protein